MDRNRAVGPRLDLYLSQALSHLQRKAFEVWLATHATTIEQRRPLTRRSQRDHDSARDQRELLLLQLDLWQTENADGALATELARLTKTIRENEHYMWDFALSDGQQFGAGQITQGLRFFGVTISPFEPPAWQNADLTRTQRLLEVLGYLPQQMVRLLALNDRADDHLLQAYAAADLADDLMGWVRVDLRPQFHTPRGEAAWSAEQTRSLAQTLDGRYHELRIGKKRHDYLLDGDSLRAWAQHPAFYLRG